MNKLSSEGFEKRILACETCHTSLEICPDCNGRKIHAHPLTKMFCSKCDKELIKVGKYEEPGEMMGVDGAYVTPVFGCPTCEAKWCYATHEDLETVYVKTLP